jgi:hypothetical protein
VALQCVVAQQVRGRVPVKREEPTAIHTLDPLVRVMGVTVVGYGTTWTETALCHTLYNQQCGRWGDRLWNGCGWLDRLLECNVFSCGHRVAGLQGECCHGRRR